MASRVRGGNTILLCLGLFLLVCCNCTRLRRLKALHKLKGNHGQANVNELSHGRLIIGQNYLQSAKPERIEAMTNLIDDDTDYQADMVWGQHETLEGFSDGVSGKKSGGAALDQILKMEPKVECTGNTMKLQVQDSAFVPGSLFFIDRGGHLSPLPLAKLPQSCGYSIRSTLRDLLLVAPYDGCYVALEEENYVLPLRWLGLPVKMSCPLRQSSPNPPMVTCHSDGMVVKMECAIPVSKIKVNLDGNWEPLMKASSRCGFGVVEHPEGVVVSVRYAPCLQKKDGMYTLEVAGDRETKISCPSLLPVQPEPTKNLENGLKLETETPSQRVHPYTPFPILTTLAPESTSKGPLKPVPEVSKEKPNHSLKDIYEPHLPYLPYYPNFFYPYPANPHPKSTPTAPPTSPPVTKTTDAPKSQHTVPPAKPQVTPEAQVPQSFFPLPFHPWPVHPKRPGTEQPQPYGKENLYPYLPHFKPPNPEGFPSAPGPEPVPFTASPNVKTNNQRWYPFYHFPVYPQPDKPGTSTEPPVTSPSSSLNNLSLTLPEQSVPIKPTIAEEPQGPMYQQFYPYIWSKGHYEMPLPPTHHKPSTKGQTEQSSGPLEPEASKPKAPENVSLVKPSVPESKEPPQLHTPQGQIYQPFYPYPFYHWSAPEKLPEELPTAVPVPPETKAPQGYVSQPFNPQPEPNKPNEKPPAVAMPPNPPQPEDSQGQVYQPFYPYPFYQWPAPEKLPEELPTAVPVPPETKAPQGYVSQSFNLQPEPENEPDEKPTAVPKPPKQLQPESLHGQLYYPFYHNPFFPNHLYPQPNHPDEIYTDPQPGAPQRTGYQPYYPSLFQPQAEPEKQDKPIAVPKPESTKAPSPEPSEMPGEVSTEKPAPNVQPPAVNPPQDRGPHPFNLYYYLQQPPSVTLGPTTSKQQPYVNTPASGQSPTKSTIPQPGGMLPQDPQPGSLYRPPVHCPSFCPSGFSNCCPQIAFHQHLHHIVPAVPGSKDVPPIYTGLPFLSPVVYSGFGNGLGTTPTPQNPTETTATTTPTPTTTQSPSGNEKLHYPQPPGGNTATPSSGNPVKPTNPEHMYPYFVPNSLYPSWPYPPPQEEGQNLPQGKSPPHNRMASKTLAPIFPMLPHDPYKMLPQKQENPSAGDMQNPSGLNFMSFSKLPPYNTESSGSKWPTHSNLQSGRNLVPYYMLQDAESHTPNKTAVPYESSQPSAVGSKDPARHEQTLNTYSGPKNYVLLQRGPPGSEPNVFSASPLPFRHIVHDAIFQPQNLAKNKGSKRQTPQQSKWLGKGISGPLPSDVNKMLRPGVDSGSLPPIFSPSNNPHTEPLQQDPSLSPPSLKPNFLNSFKRSWKPMTPRSSSQWIPPHVPRSKKHFNNGVLQLTTKEMD